MDAKSILSIILIEVLGFISAGVAFAFTYLPYRSQVRLFYLRCHGDDCDECLYFRSAAFYMVVGAIICLIVALIMISISSDCGRGRTTYSSTRTSQSLVVLGFVFCWLFCLGAIILFILAGITQYGVDISKIRLYSYLPSKDISHKRTCYSVRRYIYSGAAVATLIGVGLGASVAIVGEYNKKLRRANQYNSNERQQLRS